MILRKALINVMVGSSVAAISLVTLMKNFAAVIDVLVVATVLVTKSDALAVDDVGVMN